MQKNQTRLPARQEKGDFYEVFFKLFYRKHKNRLKSLKFSTGIQKLLTGSSNYPDVKDPIRLIIINLRLLLGYKNMNFNTWFIWMEPLCAAIMNEATEVRSY